MTITVRFCWNSWINPSLASFHWVQIVINRFLTNAWCQIARYPILDTMDRNPLHCLNSLLKSNLFQWEESNLTCSSQMDQDDAIPQCYGPAFLRVNLCSDRKREIRVYNELFTILFRKMRWLLILGIPWTLCHKYLSISLCLAIS